MIEIPDAGVDDYIQEAHDAMAAAGHDQPDFGRWLAGGSADLGSTVALIAGRPGWWETHVVRQLANGAVGWDDDDLADYRSPLP